jgi:2-polyprenyl-3-methyl-5-hydroxy-6-metoxy-1,4-benzoquinol methylase
MLHYWNKRLRKIIVRLFPGHFSRLYSTTDEPAQIPVQAAAYNLALERYVLPGDRILDVGFGLGYGLQILSTKPVCLAGVEIDRKAVETVQKLAGGIQGLDELLIYDGRSLPYEADSFNVITCVDVLEHVPDYLYLLREMLRVASRLVFLSTPKRRPENTFPNGRPRNPWHLREWTMEELDFILHQLPDVQVEWNFLDGLWAGPFHTSRSCSNPTLALTPALIKQL